MSADSLLRGRVIDQTAEGRPQGGSPMPTKGERKMTDVTAPVAPAVPKRPKAVTVNAKQLSASVADKHQITKKLAATMVSDLVRVMTKHLKKGATIRIAGLGILRVRKRGPRMGRNPATGEAIKIKASKRVAFRAAKELRDAV